MINIESERGIHPLALEQLKPSKSAAFLLFPSHLFGLIYGFLNLLNGLATLLADPIFRIIQVQCFNLENFYLKKFDKGPLEGNYTPVHYILALLVLSTIVQNIHLLRHKSEAELRKKDSSEIVLES